MDEFGFRGTFIITGSIILNIMIFGLFLTPFNVDEIQRKAVANSQNYGYQSDAVECRENSFDAEAKGTPSKEKSHSDVENGSPKSPSTPSPKRTSKSPMSQSLSDLLIYSGPPVWDDSNDDNDDAKHPLLGGSKISASGTASGTSGEMEASRNCLSVFNFALFKNPRFLIVVLCAVFGIHSATTMNIYIPALAKGKGITKLQAALLLSVVGATGIVGRLLVGFIADLSIIKRSLMMTFALMVSGVSAICAPLYSGLETMIGYCVIYGIFGGLYFSLLPVVLVDFLGEKHLSTSFGFLQLFSGVSMAAINPIAGKNIFVSKSNITSLGKNVF